MRVLVVGAKQDSLGAAVADACREQEWEVVTAGVSECGPDREDRHLDLVSFGESEIRDVMSSVKPDHVVCTSGVNKPLADYRDEGGWYSHHFAVNVTGPMRLLTAYAEYGVDTERVRVGHFVAISSNSAQIPRTYSGAYCASKAALSMALRVAAREAATHHRPFVVYGYEPGLLAGTPMTEEASDRFTGPLTRMRGRGVLGGLSVLNLAGHIVHNIGFGGQELNGTTLRLDAGEL